MCLALRSEAEAASEEALFASMVVRSIKVSAV